MLQRRRWLSEIWVSAKPQENLNFKIFCVYVAYGQTSPNWDQFVVLTRQSKDIKWSAVPLPCYVYLIKIVSCMQGSGPGSSVYWKEHILYPWMKFGAYWVRNGPSTCVLASPIHISFILCPWYKILDFQKPRITVK